MKWIEGALEYLVTDRASFELFGATELDGEEEFTVAGFGVNLFLGE